MSGSQPTASGIITTASGERHIPESKRADGSTRKAIKVRPGYQPPEDVAKFRIKNQQQNRSQNVPGAESLQVNKADHSATANKNAKRREARKKAKAASTSAEEQNEVKLSEPQSQSEPKTIDPEIEKEKKARNLRKKLKQARELKSKKEGGGILLPEQVEKVIRINQLIQQLEDLGFQDEEVKPTDENLASTSSNTGHTPAPI